MDFYNPMQRRAPRTEFSATGSGYTAPKGPNRYKIGALDMEMLGGKHGTGADFQGAGRVGTLTALADTNSVANPEDYAAMDEMRSYYRNLLADQPGQNADRMSTFDTSAQRGLQNLLSQHKSANAGTGRLGSRQYAGAAGDITSRAASEYMTGLINERSAAVDRANKIQSGLSGVQNQNMLERQFQADQGQRFSDMIYKLMALDKNTPDVGAQRAEADRARTGQMIQSGATLAALAAMSDATAKTDIRPATRDEVLKPFRKAKSYKYRYKDAAHGLGDKISPMAQELQQTEFRDAVIPQADGLLMVDYGKLLPKMFSAISELTKQVDELKGELRAERARRKAVA